MRIKSIFAVLISFSFSFAATQSSWHLGIGHPFSLNAGFQSLHTGFIPKLHTLARADLHFFPGVRSGGESIKLVSASLTGGLAATIPAGGTVSLTPKLGINGGMLLPISGQSEPLSMTFGVYAGADIKISRGVILGLSFYSMSSDLFEGRWLTLGIGFLK